MLCFGWSPSPACSFPSPLPLALCSAEVEHEAVRVQSHESESWTLQCLREKPNPSWKHIAQATPQCSAQALKTRLHLVPSLYMDSHSCMQKNNSLLLARAPQAANPAAPPRKGCSTAQTRLQLQLLSQHVCTTPRQHGQQNPARNGHILTQDPNKKLSHSQPVFRLAPHAPS